MAVTLADSRVKPKNKCVCILESNVSGAYCNRQGSRLPRGSTQPLRPHEEPPAEHARRATAASTRETRQDQASRSLRRHQRSGARARKSSGKSASWPGQLSSVLTSSPTRQEAGKLLLRQDPIEFNGNTLQIVAENTTGPPTSRPIAPPSGTSGFFVPRNAVSRRALGWGASSEGLVPGRLGARVLAHPPRAGQPPRLTVAGARRAKTISEKCS